MPNRTILNKYGLFVSQIHKVLKKKGLYGEDFALINKARLVATLSSNHSWRTSRFIHGNDLFDKKIIREEVNAAYNEGWKEINENDLKEVATSHLDDHAFLMVLNCGAFDRSEVKEFKTLMPQLLEELVDGIEPIENREL